jgi:hypothetical protein
LEEVNMQMTFRKPNYFFAAFGPAHIAHPVDGGCYPHKKGFISNSNLAIGDVVLLYCTDDYPGYPKEAPGVGVVIGIETTESEEKFYYQYFPLDRPVDWGTIKQSIRDLEGYTNFGWIGNWLREISSASFRKAVAGRQINWP